MLRCLSVTVTQARGIDSVQVEVWQGHLIVNTGRIQTALYLPAALPC